ncbi:MAG: HIT family protein [Ilumatobacteraceae bacterium]
MPFPWRPEALRRIWSGWRSAYLARRVEGDSDDTFVRILESDSPDEATHIVARRGTAFAILNIHPYCTGHLLVLPVRKVRELSELDSDETRDLWGTVAEAVEVLRAEYAPDGLNVGINLGRAAGGTIPGHLHIHVVPRWIGDGNFLAATSDTKIIPEALDVTADRVRRRWNDVSGTTHPA